jgi:hypothetical protein
MYQKRIIKLREAPPWAGSFTFPPVFTAAAASVPRESFNVRKTYRKKFQA